MAILLLFFVGCFACFGIGWTARELFPAKQKAKADNGTRHIDIKR